MSEYPAREMKLIRTVVQTLNSLEDMHARHVCDSGSPFSGTLHLSGSWGSTVRPVCTAWRIDRKQVRLLISQLKTLQEQQPLLLADYISQPLANELTGAHVQFLDSAGNGFLHAPPLYLNRSGNKPAKAAPLPNRCVQSAGLRVLYHLVRKPELAQDTYREIAAEAGVALGSVGPVLKELQRKKILSAPDTQERQVLNHKGLHQLWESSFIHKLRPRLQIERCSPTHPWRVGSIPSLIKTSKLEEDVILGGELAAAFYCDHIEARRATLHVERKRALKLMLQLRLTPDPEGCIDIVANFSSAIAYPQRSAEGLLLAEPYLVHAELMSAEEQETRIAHQLAQEYFHF
ncbi:MAG: type IV toxin-antitoxin system AbiEi family antitoxin [Desulfuromonadaceae bacterium]